MNAKFRINVLTSIVSFLISIFMTLWFTPFIVSSLGVEALGYTNLVTNLINVSMVVTLAITSMSNRYISIELQREDVDNANKYFNSILFSLLLLSMFLFSVFLCVLFNLDRIIHISPGFIKDVKILFLLSYVQFLVGLVSTPFLGGVYFQNKLKITYMFNILSYCFKFLLSVAVFHYLRPILWIPNVAVLMVSIVSLIYYIATYKNTMPGVNINILRCDLSYIFTVFKSGLWISISKAGSVLLGTLNIYFSNLLVGPNITGIYSAVLQLQMLTIVLVNAVVPSFVPDMYKKFADDRMDSLVSYVTRCIWILSIPLGIVIGGVLSFGKFFMTLWLGKQFGHYDLLLVLVIVYLPFVLPAEVLSQFNVTLNKVKHPAITTLLFGIANVLLILFLFRLTTLGFYSIVIAQLVTTTLRGFIYFPVYSAKSVGSKPWVFYPAILLGVGSTCMAFVIGLFISNIISPDTWGKLFADVIMLLLVFLLAVVFFVGVTKRGSLSEIKFLDILFKRA